MVVLCVVWLRQFESGLGKCICGVFDVGGSEIFYRSGYFHVGEQDYRLV